MEEGLEKAIKKFKEGKDEGFEEFYKLTVNYVYSIAYAYLLSKEDTEDVVAETYLKLYSIRRRIEPSPQVLAYIKKITINNAVKLLNKKKMRFAVVEHLIEHNSPQEEADFILIRDAVSRLDAKDRAVITMFYFEKYSIGEISFMLNESESSIKTRLFRARERLKEVLQDGEV